jgi:hypothetical protein
MVQNILGIGKMKFVKALGLNIGQMGLVMKESGNITKHVAMANFTILAVMSLKANGKMIKPMDSGSTRV